MKHFTLKYWWHYIPFIALAFVLSANFRDPWLGSILVMMMWWLILLLIIWAIIAFGKSWEIGGAHKYLITSLSAIEITALVLLFLVRIPAYKCNPDEMVGHYDKKKAEMEALVSFTESALDDGQGMYLEFEHGKVSIFHTSSAAHWEDADSLKSEIMGELGLDEEEFRSIKKKLKSIKCISIHTHFPDYCDIGYKRVAMGLYSYRLYLNPMSEEVRQNALKDGHFIPYNETTLLMFGGGAAGPDTFSHEVKEDFLRRHPFPSPVSSE